MVEVSPLKVKAENGLVRILKTEGVEWVRPRAGEQAEKVEDPDEVAPAFNRAFKEKPLGRPAYFEVICYQYPIFGRWISSGQKSL